MGCIWVEYAWMVSFVLLDALGREGCIEERGGGCAVGARVQGVGLMLLEEVARTDV